MQGRRKFLRAAGALTAFGVVGQASANGRGNGPAVEAIHNNVHSGVQRDGAEGAKRALDTLGLDSVVRESRSFELAGQEEIEEVIGDESDVSAEYAYADPVGSDSSIVVSLSSVWGSNDEVMMTTSMNLRGCSKTMRNSWWIDDAIGVGFLHQDWAPVGVPSVSATQDHTARFTEEDVANDALAGTVDIKNHAYNVATCYALPDATVTLSGRFKLRSGGEPSTLWGSYSHTIASDPWGAITGISGGAGGIQVSTNRLSTTHWSIADPVDPEIVL